MKFFSATAGIVDVAPARPALNNRSGDPPRCGLGESTRQGLTTEGRAPSVLLSFASRSPSGDRPTFLSALLQIPPHSYFPGFTVVYFTSLIRPGAVPSEGRWRRHPRSASLAALLPGVLLYDRLGISHGTLAPWPAEEPRPGPPVHHSGTPQQRVCVEIASQLARHGGGRLTCRRLVADTRSTFNHNCGCTLGRSDVAANRVRRRDWSRMPREGFRPHASTARTNCCISMQQQHHHRKRRQTPAQQRAEGFKRVSAANQKQRET